MNENKKGGNRCAERKLLELAKPLQKFLDDNYHHHCAVVITLDNAKVVEVQVSTPLPQE